MFPHNMQHTSLTFLKINVCICVEVYACDSMCQHRPHTHAGACTENPGARVTGSYELSYVGAENQIHIFCKSSMLTLLALPHLDIDFLFFGNARDQTHNFAHYCPHILSLSYTPLVVHRFVSL